MYNPYFQPQMMRQSNFVRVRSKAEMDMIPVAPGGSVTGVDETAPLVYVKSLGPSQFDRPTLLTYKLELVPDEPVKAPETPAEPFALRSDVIALRGYQKAPKIGAFSVHVGNVSVTKSGLPVCW